MIKVDFYAEKSCDKLNNSLTTYSILSWCTDLCDVEEYVLSLCELYKLDIKDVKRIFIYIEGDNESEKN